VAWFMLGRWARVTARTAGPGGPAIAAALGAVLILLGLGVVWAARPVAETETVTVTKRPLVPATA
jgi:hypothetical protein